MAAKIILTAIGVLVGAAGLSGCTSTSQTKATPALAAASTPAVEEDTPTVALPETVAVLPEPSGLAQVQTAALTGDASATGTPGALPPPEQPGVALPPPAQPGAALPPPTQPTAFAGSTPVAGQFPPPPVLMAGASPTGPGSLKHAAVYATAGVAMPVTGQTAKVAPMPGVQQVAYVSPENPALLAAPGQPVKHAIGPRGEIERLIEKYSAIYEVPIDLVRHVVNRESTFNPKAYNHGHWGLMQIKHATARGMGYDGPASGLFDAETNLKYAVKYLRGAWLVSGGNEKRADQLYQSGYYYDAKRKGLLEATGLGVDRTRRRLPPDA
ncbi:MULTISPECIES: transglycosylase SLT domain-containing protein [unclassified Mesorhizobium]|uniref:transglycosylase SLT domain-containing protein n=1 Tax=unclassified Mesorhizobium TaxID=325217 RepID=UPI000BB004BF|nr:MULTISPECIES: transglycosylase SLT domain-containing protein [unclassified Mesorhizobium]TGT57362.1 lytic transglycosylase domain-containing protein [Mesorhizobium sp. M00.F.Ca.ET.170.01.1.1]AZO11907.1 lytic transglycosylase domain-containing protein [Mesorhizobium sp. M3A.F.Ca.ET.080.04.2.1]PBB86201.1 lytic transglycosylase [Mesorhizobium sp. WSM3876]RWB73189.1 MAG: lytic transglycosylase domain-containing protein [Mesorhizobium sp.]RWB82672.1 MAG: lytic transglycosylase domain-containing 